MLNIQTKPLTMPDQNNPQIREYINAIERGRDTLHIFPDARGWTLKKIGGESFGVFDTQDNALAHAEEYARLHTIPEIITHDEQGYISERITIAEPELTLASSLKRSWWELWK